MSALSGPHRARKRAYQPDYVSHLDDESTSTPKQAKDKIEYISDLCQRMPTPTQRCATIRGASTGAAMRRHHPRALEGERPYCAVLAVEPPSAQSPSTAVPDSIATFPGSIDAGPAAAATSALSA